MNGKENIVKGIVQSEKNISPWTIFIVFLVVIAIGSVVGFLMFRGPGEEIQDSSLLIKATLARFETHTERISIINHGSESATYEISLSGLEDMISFQEESFEIGPEETKELSVLFSNLGEYGVYSGSISIVSQRESIVVPIILEVQEENPIIDGVANLIPSSNADPGERVIVDLKIYDLADIGPTEINVRYGLKDFTGKTILEQDESLILNSRSLMTRFIEIPSDIPKGDYLFFVVTDYNTSASTISSILNVEKEPFFNFLGENQVYLFVLIVVFLIFFLIFVLYNENSQAEIISRLRDQYREELGSQMEFLKLKEKENESRLTSPEEIRKNREYFKKLIDKVKAESKEVHRSRIFEVKKIGDSTDDGKQELMKEKLKKWEKEGYVMPSSLKNIIPSVNKIKNEVKRETIKNKGGSK